MQAADGKLKSGAPLSAAPGPAPEPGAARVSSRRGPAKAGDRSEDQNRAQATPPPSGAPAAKTPLWKKRKLIIPLVLLALCGLAYYAWHAHAAARTKKLLLYGNVDIREVSLGFRVAGKLLDVLKDEGDSIKEGETIARLDSEPIRREMEQAAAQVESAKAKLALMQAGYRREDIERARAAVAEAEAALTNAAGNLSRKKELLAKKVVSQQEVDDAVAARDQAQARLKSARDALALQQAGFRPEEIAQAHAEVSQAEAALASARLRLTDTELKAPSDGIVMTRAYERGAILPTGATLFPVSPVNPVWVRAYVPEDRLGDIHPGMQVTVLTDSDPDHPYRGQIGYISPQAEFTPKSVETPELRTSLVYRLRVVVSDPRGSLRQGMPVTVRLPDVRK